LLADSRPNLSWCGCAPASDTTGSLRDPEGPLNRISAVAVLPTSSGATKAGRRPVGHERVGHEARDHVAAAEQAEQVLGVLGPAAVGDGPTRPGHHGDAGQHQGTDGDQDVFMVSRSGMAIRFKEDEVRAMGRAAAGVRGMKLRAGDEVVSCDVARPDVAMLLVTDAGYGKRTQLEHFNAPGRGGQGMRGINRHDGRSLLA
jgi:DNA gyrase/topoisomerase IV subunit A